MNGVNKAKVINCLRELTDYDFQQRVWLASSGPEVSSLTEAVCGLFDDSRLDVAFDKGRTVFTGEIDSLLHELGNLVRSVDEFQPPAILIRDPRMERVRKLAAEALSAIERTT
jgi:hypothetical protein